MTSMDANQAVPGGMRPVLIVVDDHDPPAAWSRKPFDGDSDLTTTSLPPKIRRMPRPSCSGCTAQELIPH